MLLEPNYTLNAPDGDIYKIGHPKGNGANGVTYVAEDLTRKRKVIIKTLLNPERGNLKERHEKFLKEARSLMDCEHRNIVQVYKVFECEVNQLKLPFMVQQLIEGVDLQQYLDDLKKEGRCLLESEALAYVSQICDALKVVHNRGLIHRDVKPNNIMIQSGEGSNDKKAILIDFGIAREFTTSELSLTATGDKSYIPIEQYLEGLSQDYEQGTWTDIYSLAATLYYLLTGKEPLTSVARYVIRNDRLEDKLEPPKYINSSINSIVSDAIIKGMGIQRNERPQTIQEWQNSLNIRTLEGLEVEDEYKVLKHLLVQKRWLEANWETRKIVLEACGRDTSNFLTSVDIKKCSLTCLRRIDRLWSLGNESFGFTVQKNVWIEKGKPELEIHIKRWEDFFQEIGWVRREFPGSMFSFSWPDVFSWQVEERINHFKDMNHFPKGYLPNLSGIFDLNELKNPISLLNYMANHFFNARVENRLFLAALYNRIEEAERNIQ